MDKEKTQEDSMLDEEEELREQVQLCQEFASECGCLDGPYPFPSAYTKYAYLSGRDVPPEVPLLFSPLR